MTAEGMIDYEALAQDAMRGVVRAVLMRTAKSGLPGEHHFYVSFDTQAAGVSISKRLKEKYREEMTIVLQHRFWDLIVTDERFEVKLTFDGIPERLVVPFAAIKVFLDPSVRYALQFEAGDFGPDATAHPQSPRDDIVGGERRLGGPSMISGAGGRSGPRALGERKPRAPRKRPEKIADPAVAENDAVEKPAPAPEPSAGAGKVDGDGARSGTPAPSGGATIVKLDQFRKK